MSTHHEHDLREHKDAHKGHHILPPSMALKIWAALMVLTVLTVWVAGIDFGRWNMVIAMLVATIKGTLVAAFFMGLKYDRKFNTVIFVTSIVFFLIFVAFTATDIFFRTPIRVRPIAMQSSGKFSKPWTPSAEIAAHGKELFGQQCVSCHGAEGKGNGPAAAALNPPPRNFTVAEGWKNGRKPSQIFGTLTKGLNAMPAFASLGDEDRWALSHYVAGLGPNVLADTEADIRAQGVDPTKAASAGAARTLPIDVAIDLMATE